MTEPTPRPWQWWTSNSWRRLHGPEPHNEPVLMPVVNRADGHPDITVKEADMALIVRAVNCHESLHTALKVVMEHIDDLPDGHRGGLASKNWHWFTEARAALAKVKEES